MPRATRLPATAVRRSDPRNDPAWARLAAARDADVFHAPAWLRALARGYGVEPAAWLVVEEDAGGSAPAAARSGLVACALDDLLGPRTISLPFSDFCDPLLGDAADWAPLADAWLAAGDPARVRTRAATAPAADARFAETGWAFWHAVDLRADEDERWAALHPAARRNVARARRAGVWVDVASDRADLRAFHDLHVALRQSKYGLLAQPWAFFEALWEEFVEADRGALLLARLDGEPVAGILLLEAFGKLYYKFNASSPAHLDARPNDLLVWRALELGAARGLRWLDLGVSDHDQPGLVRYKRKFATREGRVATLQAPGVLAPAPAAAEARALLGDLTRLLTAPDVPRAVAARAGERLYRYFA